MTTPISKLLNEILSIREIKSSLIKREMAVRKILRQEHNVETHHIWRVKDEYDLTGDFKKILKVLEED